MDKLLCELADDGCEDVRRGEFVYRLCEGDEDQRDLELMVCEVSASVRNR